MRQLLALLILAVTVYGIVDCAQADARTRRNIPLWIWVTVMVLLPGVGAIIWLVMSRLVAPGPSVQRNRPVAPDDDPEFLRELDRRTRKHTEDEQHGDDPQPGSDRPAGGVG